MSCELEAHAIGIWKCEIIHLDRADLAFDFATGKEKFEKMANGGFFESRGRKR
jgi:hypothetical protein